MLQSFLPFNADRIAIVGDTGDSRSYEAVSDASSLKALSIYIKINVLVTKHFINHLP